MIYIVHRDLPYEFGEVYGVWSTPEKAETSRAWHQKRIKAGKDEFSVIECQLDAERFGEDQYQPTDITKVTL